VTDRFRKVFGDDKVIIGMIHLPPLPGYAASPGIEALVSHAVADLATLEDCGVKGVLIENEHDRPHRVAASPEVVAAMTRISRAVVQESRRAAVGCEILLNDPRASLAAARMAGARFIRTDYFVDRMSRPGYGEFEIDPHGLRRYRQLIGAEKVLVLADIQVKYATMIEPVPLAESARLAAANGADAVIVTGGESGSAPSIEDLRAARGAVPVLIGSGLDPDNADELLAECDGAIVGTSIMAGGHVDADAVELLMSRIPGR